MLLSLLALGCGDHVVVEDYLALVALSPSHGAANISTDVDVRLTFNDSIDEGTLPGAVWIEDTIGTVMPATLSYEAETWTVVLTPDQDLAASSTYAVRITSGLAGVDYGPLPADLTTSFATVGPASGGGGNEAPVALIAQPDLPCEVGVPLALSGLESTDPEGAELSYAWRVVNPPEAGAFSDDTAADTELTVQTPGQVVVGLVVDDGDRSSSEDYLQLACSGGGDPEG
jgi:hypothetical protein